MVCMMVLYYGIFTQGGINLFLKVIHKFGSYILAVDKPTGVINIPERYTLDLHPRITDKIEKINL